MDFDGLKVPTDSEAHPETLDVLTSSWCNFAIHALQPQPHIQSSAFVESTSPKTFEGDALKMGMSTKMEDMDFMKSIPSWKSKHLKWRTPVCNVSIKKWLKEMKEKRKEETRLERAEIHAAVSVAGLAAALAAIADENSKGELEIQYRHSPARKTALASAAAMVAYQCAQMAELMGANRGQLRNVINLALSATSTTDILTLAATASTSLRGAAALKARAGNKSNTLKGAPVLPIEMDNRKLDDDLDFQRRTSVLAKGAILTIKDANGKTVERLVSLHLNKEAEVVLKIMKRVLSVITSKKECVVLDIHAELYKASGRQEYDTCYQIGLTTSKGTFKLDMADNYQRYKMWATTINQMLMLSPSLTKYKHRFCKY